MGGMGVGGRHGVMQTMATMQNQMMLSGMQPDGALGMGEDGGMVQPGAGGE